MNNSMSDILDQSLLEIASGEKTIEECLQQYPQLNQDLVELLRISQWVRAAPPVVPQPEFRTQAQTRMRNLIKAYGPYQSSSRLASSSVVGKREHLALRNGLFLRFALAFAVILLLLLGSGTGVVLASRDSLPGDTLYSVKTFVEDVRLLLADDEADVDLLNAFADKRLAELEALAQTQRSEDILAAGQAYQNTVSELAQALGKLPADERREALLALLTAAHERRTEVLTGLLEKVPEQAQKGILNALQAGPPEKIGKPDPGAIQKETGKPEPKPTHTPKIKPEKENVKPTKTEKPPKE